MEAFEAWLLHRVAHAVEAGEVSGDVLADLHGALESARVQPPREGHALTVHEIAERVNVPVAQIEHLLAAFEAQPSLIRQWLLRRLAEAWLAGQRRGDGARGRASEPEGGS